MIGGDDWWWLWWWWSRIVFSMVFKTVFTIAKKNILEQLFEKFLITNVNFSGVWIMIMRAYLPS